MCSAEALSSGHSAKIPLADVFQMLVTPEGGYAVLASCCCDICAGNLTLLIKKLVHVKFSFPDTIENYAMIPYNGRKSYSL